MSIIFTVLPSCSCESSQSPSPIKQYAHRKKREENDIEERITIYITIYKLWQSRTRISVEIPVIGRHVTHLFLFLLGWHSHGAVGESAFSLVVVVPYCCEVQYTQSGGEAEEG